MNQTPSIEVVYIEENGAEPYKVWLNQQTPADQAKMTKRLEQAESGNLGRVAKEGQGVLALKFIGKGPGFRIYFGMEGKTRVIVLLGGTKRTQKDDIKRARELWTAYKASKKEG